jgi:type IV pili sensor histidine kinase/response regulator
LLTVIVATGCATKSLAPPAAPEPEAQTRLVPDGWVPVARYGRYTLVELTPEAGQYDLLFQVIDVSMPATLPATVGDALRYVLLRSGYRLCDADTDARTLYALPLPAAHQRLGPMVLRDALLTLAGSAWDLQIDAAARRVCFALRADARDIDTQHPDTIPVPADTAEVVTFPFSEPLP